MQLTTGSERINWSGGLESDTIGGFNAFFEKQRQLEGETIVTTLLNVQYEILWNGMGKGVTLTKEENNFLSLLLIDRIGPTIIGSRCSSRRVYYREKEYLSNLIQTSLILGMFAETTTEAIDCFKCFIEEENEDKCLDDNNTKYLPDSEAIKIIISLMNEQPVSALHNMPKVERYQLLKRQTPNRWQLRNHRYMILHFCYNNCIIMSLALIITFIEL